MLRIEKVIGGLPNVINPSTLYFVRVGLGVDIYISDLNGNVAHKVNTDQDLVLRSQLVGLYNSNEPVTEDDTILSALSKLNTQLTQLAQALEEKLGRNEEATSAKKWTEAVRLNIAGVATGTTQLDGSEDVTINLALSNIDLGILDEV